MKRKRRGEWIDAVDEMRPIERTTFCLIGIVPDQIEEFGKLFGSGDKEKLSGILMQEAGLPWAKAFEEAWEAGEQEARQRGLFDLMWHRRAMAIDPVLNAPNFSGWDVLMTVARQVDADLAGLLSNIDGNNRANPRRQDGPQWWKVWHHGTGAPPGGWLTVEESALVHEKWRNFAIPEIEEACLEMQGLSYTHQGCWTLMNDMGGFFAQCASERRAVVGEVGL